MGSTSARAASRGRRLRPAEIAGGLAFHLAGWFALLIAGFGVESVLFNRDVITDTHAGTGLGPTMVVGALVALATCLTSFAAARRRRATTQSPYAFPSLVAALSTYVAYPATALVGLLATTRDTPATAAEFAFTSALDWPAVTILVISFVTALSFFAYLSWRTRNVL